MAAKWLAFHLTDRCNLNCTHCLRDPQQKPEDLPLDLVKRVLSDARRTYGTGHVALTGGEPTLHPRFPEVLDAIVDEGMTWHMVTNGDRFDRVATWLSEAPPRREALTAINFSVDGAEEATHDRIRGEGSYREVMTSITLCKVHRIDFTLSMAVNAINVAEVESLGLMASQLGAERVAFGMTLPTGTHLDQEMFMSAAEWEHTTDRLHRLLQTLRIPVVLNEGFPTSETFHVCEPFKTDTLHVDSQGRLSVCCMHSGVPGGNRDVAADLSNTPLLEAHKRLLGIIHEVKLERLDELGVRNGPWDRFSCNTCMRLFDKPFWTDAGADGAEAKRERWRGAWASDVEPTARAGRRVKLTVV